MDSLKYCDVHLGDLISLTLSEEQVIKKVSKSFRRARWVTCDQNLFPEMSKKIAQLRAKNDVTYAL